MVDVLTYKESFLKSGFVIIDNVYSHQEIAKIIELIEKVDTSKDIFRKSEDLFAIRQFLKEVPDVITLIFNEPLCRVIKEIFDETYFVSKSIYFDKPEHSNWFVAYHQDLTISVDSKVAIDGFGPWTIKQNQFSVQPPLSYLEDSFTIRIHLDDTNEFNGALKVIQQSHKKGIFRLNTIDLSKEKETICTVKKGGVMIMRPLLMHASNRTINNKKRRVVHIEFNNKQLPENLNWSEKLELKELYETL